MATDEQGRWQADPHEPFNAGLDGIDPQTVRDAADPAHDGCALALLWVSAVGSIVIGVLGSSAILVTVGGVWAILASLWGLSRRGSARR